MWVPPLLREELHKNGCGVVEPGGVGWVVPCEYARLVATYGGALQQPNPRR
jgi:hypothetical protein